MCTETANNGAEATPLEIAQDMLDNANSNPNFLNTVITGEKLWVYGYDPETKMQSSQWKHPTSPGQKKHGRSAAMSRSCWPFSSTPVGWFSKKKT
jgi:hypothetical protein